MKKEYFTIGSLFLAGMILCFIAFIQCAALAPTKQLLITSMQPVVPENSELYSVSEDGALAYEEKGMKIVVKPMDDEKLNKMFPEISYKRDASTNPYTFGNWIDPELGYTPIRFTAFVVKVFNYTKPKINLDPRIAILQSGRGDKLYSYTRDQKEDADREIRSVEDVGSALNFESYYMKLRGSSGVERDRFEKRMGIVRQTLYVDGPVFKGDKKEGMLVFDPLDPGVKSIELVLKDFVFEFDATNWPKVKKDVVFKFSRELIKETAK
ncbi:hypothetical protein JXJ21_16970 [candidate division KSB1 bacterium]|nr:hypothetical protein [candidate division KSB1 bacterium]